MHVTVREPDAGAAQFATAEVFEAPLVCLIRRSLQSTALFVELLIVPVFPIQTKPRNVPPDNVMECDSDGVYVVTLLPSSAKNS